MRWAFRIGFAVLAAVIAGAVARADDQSTYAPTEHARSWQPAPPEAPQEQAQPEQQPVRVAALAQPAPIVADAPDYRLGTGDKVRVIVYGEEDLSGEFQVDSTGFVRLPMIGQMRALGSTARELENLLMAAYAAGYLKQPRVNVEVTTYRPFYIIGEVNRPGEYPYVNGMNVINAVALAGGFTSKAIESRVWMRKNGTAKEIKVVADQTTHVAPGDIVRVDSSALWDVLSIVGPVAPLASLARGY